MNLYELDGRWGMLQQLLDETGGEMTAEVEHLMAELEEETPNIIEWYVKLAKNFEADATCAQVEAARLRRLVATNNAKHDKIEARIKDLIKKRNLGNVKTQIGSVWVQRNSVPTIKWDGDPENIPENLRRTFYELDTEAARDVLKNTGELPEGFVVTQGDHLRIN